MDIVSGHFAKDVVEVIFKFVGLGNACIQCKVKLQVNRRHVSPAHCSGGRPPGPSARWNTRCYLCSPKIPEASKRARRLSHSHILSDKKPNPYFSIYNKRGSGNEILPGRL